jgi:peptide/nickel transport system permease protein
VSQNNEPSTVADEAETSTATRSSGLIRQATRLWRTKIGLFLVLILVAIAIFGPFFAPHNPSDFVAAPNSTPGGGAGLFGTDYLGQDVWSRFLYGGRSILILAVVSTVLGLALGILVGLVSAYSRGIADGLLMRAMDVIMAFPQIIFALVAVSLVGPQPWVIVLAIALTTVPRVARVARGSAQSVVDRDFVQASEAMGVPRWRILFGELLPNITGPMMVEANLRLTYSIGLIAALAFLGLTSDPNGPNWGTMIQQNQIALSVQPWGALLPIIAIALLTVGTGLIGDGIARTAAGIDRRMSA